MQGQSNICPKGGQANCDGKNIRKTIFTVLNDLRFSQVQQNRISFVLINNKYIAFMDTLINLNKSTRCSFKTFHRGQRLMLANLLTIAIPNRSNCLGFQGSKCCMPCIQDSRWNRLKHFISRLTLYTLLFLFWAHARENVIRRCYEAFSCFVV